MHNNRARIDALCIDIGNMVYPYIRRLLFKTSSTKCNATSPTIGKHLPTTQVDKRQSLLALNIHPIILNRHNKITHPFKFIPWLSMNTFCHPLFLHRPSCSARGQSSSCISLVPVSLIIKEFEISINLIHKHLKIFAPKWKIWHRFKAGKLKNYWNWEWKIDFFFEILSP